MKPGSPKVWRFWNNLGGGLVGYLGARLAITVARGRWEEVGRGSIGPSQSVSESCHTHTHTPRDTCPFRPTLTTHGAYHQSIERAIERFGRMPAGCCTGTRRSISSHLSERCAGAIVPAPAASLTHAACHKHHTYPLLTPSAHVHNPNRQEQRSTGRQEAAASTAPQLECERPASSCWRPPPSALVSAASCSPTQRRAA